MANAGIDDNSTKSLIVRSSVSPTTLLAATATPITNVNPVNVAIVDGSGNQITTFGSGTQYADGAARGTATGTLAMGDDGTNIQSVHTDSSGDLQIDVLTMPSTAVTNAGLTELAAAINASSQMDVNIAANGIGLATSAKQDTLLTELQLKADLTETQPVSVASLPLPTGSSTLAEQQTQTTALGTLLTTSAHDAAFGTAGTADTQVRSIQGIASMTPVQVSQATGTNLHTVIDSGVITTVSAVTAISNALPAGNNNIGDIDVASSALPTGASTLAEQQTQTTSLQLLDNAISGSGFNITQLGGAAVPIGAGTEAAAIRVTLPTDSTGKILVVGSIADDATTPGAPVMIGGTAKETDGTDPSSVSAEDDVTRCITDRNRRLLVNISHPNSWSLVDTETTAQTDKALKSAPGANLSLYITDIIVSNGATAGTVLFEEDTGSAKTVKVATLYLSVYGGAVINFRTPIRITANKDFGFTSATVTTHTITVNGYTAP